MRHPRKQLSMRDHLPGQMVKQFDSRIRVSDIVSLLVILFVLYTIVIAEFVIICHKLYNNLRWLILYNAIPNSFQIFLK